MSAMKPGLDAACNSRRTHPPFRLRGRDCLRRPFTGCDFAKDPVARRAAAAHAADQCTSMLQQTKNFAYLWGNVAGCILHIVAGTLQPFHEILRC